MDVHDGELIVDSRPDHGAHFSLLLPPNALVDAPFDPSGVKRVA
jgi:signal transduction histidine kinase